MSRPKGRRRITQIITRFSPIINRTVTEEVQHDYLLARPMPNDDRVRGYLEQTGSRKLTARQARRVKKHSHRAGVLDHPEYWDDPEPPTKTLYVDWCGEKRRSRG